MLVMDKGTKQATLFLEKAIFIFKFLFFWVSNVGADEIKC